MSLVITVCLSSCNSNDMRKMECGRILYVNTIKYVQMDYVPSHSDKDWNPVSKNGQRNLA